MTSTTTKKRSSPKPPETGFWFDKKAADHAVTFFSKLKHSKGEWAGQGFTLEPWQQEIVEQVFGWKRADGSRRYRRVYIEVPRKNGKSTLAAGLALFMLYADGEPGAEVYSAAADRDQAAIVFEQAKAMVHNQPVLASVSESYRRSIVYTSQGRSYKVLSADAPTKHGLNAHGIIFDELHAQPNRDLWDVLTTSTGARRQPLVVAITTAGWDRNSICWELHDYALKVRDGIVPDDSFYPAIFAAGEEDDWTSPETWQKANPSLGRTVKEDYLAAECERAKASPAYQNTFRRLHLNQWTEQADRWIDMGLWDENAGEGEPTPGAPCFAGLDLSSTTDLSALVLLFPEGQRYRTLCRFWIPQEGLHKRAQRDRVPYDVWVREGLVTATPGDVIDYEAIRSEINALAQTYQIKFIAFDRWNATQLATQLTGDALTMVECGQGFASMSAPTKELMTVLLGRRLMHTKHPVLRWMASNMTVVQDAAGNLKPDKANSTGRIDGIVSLIMALRLATLDEGPSVYESRGLVEVEL
jgi:phage terminase large subunit-like protein